MNKSSNKQTALLDLNISPYIQAIVMLVLMLLADLISKGSGGESDILKMSKSIWTNCIAVVLLFSFGNSILALGTKNMLTYVRDSIFSFIGLCMIGILFSQYLSGLSMDESGSFRWLFIVLGMGYMIFLGIVSTMKFIVSLAKKQDSRLRGE